MREVSVRLYDLNMWLKIALNDKLKFKKSYLQNKLHNVHFLDNRKSTIA